MQSPCWGLVDSHLLASLLLPCSGEVRLCVGLAVSADARYGPKHGVYVVDSDHSVINFLQKASISELTMAGAICGRTLKVRSFAANIKNAWRKLLAHTKSPEF